MGTKTISIMDDAYELLLKAKRENESFSDVIRRITNKPSIMDVAGSWDHIPDNEIEDMKRKIKDLRKKGISRVK